MSNSPIINNLPAIRRDNRFFRRKILIHPQFQLTLIGINWLIITGMTLLIRLQAGRVLANFAPLTSVSQIARDFSIGPLEYEIDRFYLGLWLFYVLAVIFSTGITLVVSHRFAGPIIRMKSYFQDLSNSEKPVYDLKFRGGDFFSDLPPLVNAAIKRLQGK